MIEPLKDIPVYEHVTKPRLTPEGVVIGTDLELVGHRLPNSTEIIAKVNEIIAYLNAQNGQCFTQS